MNHPLLLGFISILLLISLAGFCVADTAPSITAYVQGGESSITDGINGTYVITVKDVTPYFHISQGEKSSLIPVRSLRNPTYPMSAALVLSNTDNETNTLVQVVNVSLSDGNKILSLQVNPLEYYEGERFKSFNSNSKGLETLVNSQFTKAAIYFEIEGAPPVNVPEGYCDCHTWGCLYLPDDCQEANFLH